MIAAKNPEEAKAEIEKAISAVRWALEDQTQAAAPFFRFPALRHPPEMVTYLGQRNIAIFSTDMDSFDFKLRKPEQVVKSVMTRLAEARQGHRADARLPEGDVGSGAAAARRAQGRRLQDRAHAARKSPVTSLQQYDEELMKDAKLPTVSTRPVSSVVRDVD